MFCSPKVVQRAGLYLCLLLSVAACNERPNAVRMVPVPGLPDAGRDTPAAQPADAGAPPGLDAPVITLPDAAVSDGACTPLTCTPAGGRYCGLIGNGCGDVMECGMCPGSMTCGAPNRPGVCVSDATCTPLTCETPGGKFCGTVGDGCGGELACGGCPSGQTCGGSGTPGLCGAASGCTPLTCDFAGGRYCGTIGDGCGKSLACGDCASGQICGGAGIANVCAGGPTCQPLTCVQPGGQFCNTIGDGCGKSLVCPACPAGLTCGGGGVPNLCGAPIATCTPIKCEQATGKYCGTIGDGCGKPLDCGGCTGRDTCGGGGVAGVCGNPTGPCTGLCLRQVMCPGGGKTSLVGTVLAPTPPKFGTPDPIYNAIVYVPNGTVEAFKPGVTCEQCGASVSGSPLVSTLSGADGKFRLDNVPAGDNVPLVIQLGRWRRQVVIPKVEPCTTVTLPAELTRLPRNKAEGDIPQMALSTGRVDLLECVLRKIGIDDAEFTLPTGNGRVHIYRNNGATLGPSTPAESALTASLANLSRYDMALFACQGSPNTKPAADQARLVEYANAGGRAFITHYGYSWLHMNPAWRGTALYEVERGRPPTLPATIDQSFPKGMAFATWLQTVGAQSAPGQININDPRLDVTDVVAPTQRWIYSTNPKSVQHLTFNTPVGTPPAMQCGRVLFSDFHVTDAELAANNPPTFPSECAPDKPLSPQEKVLEFMLFDLASCV
ncbi:MAG TPA: hypothetical protein VGG33_26355, partial [Polyangia bacterium]